MYQKIIRLRKEQRHSTVLCDIVNDSLFIDVIISEDSYGAAFNAGGYLFPSYGTDLQKELTLFMQPRALILTFEFQQHYTGMASPPA